MGTKQNISSDKEFDAFFFDSEKLHINNLPFEILQRILRYFSFGEIAKLRLVSKLFNEICGDILNSEFYRLKTAVQVRYTYVKSQMPRRESSKRKHFLSRENDIVETLHMRLALLNLTVGKHVERNHCCFFAGEILDEINRLLNYVKKTLYLNRPFKVTDELFDLTTMAIEYFKEHIEPTLPEVIYFTDFMGNSLTSPLKSSTCTTTEINRVPGTEPESTLSLSELNDSLENTRRFVYRNRMNINTINTSIKSLYQNINNVESIAHQIKKEQSDCKEIDVPKKCLNEIIFQLNQYNLMVDSFIKQVEAYCLNSETAGACEPLNSLQISFNRISDNYEHSNSSNCASTSQNVSYENKNEFHNLSHESKASTSTVYHKRKDNEDISENILKKRKT